MKNINLLNFQALKNKKLLKIINQMRQDLFQNLNSISGDSCFVELIRGTSLQSKTSSKKTLPMSINSL